LLREAEVRIRRARQEKHNAHAKGKEDLTNYRLRRLRRLLNARQKESVYRRSATLKTYTEALKKQAQGLTATRSKKEAESCCCSCA
jgi:hypothetical protein